MRYSSRSLTALLLILILAVPSFAGDWTRNAWSRVDHASNASVIYTTYADLKALADNGNLRPGQAYTITDYRTRCIIPGTETTPGGVEYQTGPVEPLTLTAVSGSAFAPQVTSSIYPQDVILYQIAPSEPYLNIWAGADRGWIYSRYDPTKRIKAAEDWRTIKYRTWEDVPASGNYTSQIYVDGAAYVDQYMFGNTPTPGPGIYDVELASNSQTLHNSVYGDQFNEMSLGFSSTGNRVSGLVRNCNMGIDFTSNIISGSMSKCNALGSFMGNIIGGTADLSKLQFTLFRNNTITSSLSNGLILAHLESEHYTFDTDMDGFVIADGLNTAYKTIDITGLSAIDMATPAQNCAWAGLITVTSTNASETISSIVNFSIRWPYTIIVGGGLTTLTLTVVAHDDVTADGQIVSSSAISLGPDDRVTLTPTTITNSHGTFTVLRRL